METAGGWRRPGLFNLAVVKANRGAPAAATRITRTPGFQAGPRSAHSSLAWWSRAVSYDMAWLVSGAIALAALAVIIAGRRMLLRDHRLASENSFGG